MSIRLSYQETILFFTRCLIEDDLEWPLSHFLQYYCFVSWGQTHKILIIMCKWFCIMEKSTFYITLMVWYQHLQIVYLDTVHIIPSMVTFTCCIVVQKRHHHQIFLLFFLFDFWDRSGRVTFHNPLFSLSHSVSINFKDEFSYTHSRSIPFYILHLISTWPLY